MIKMLLGYDIFSSHNVFLDIQNYTVDIWNGFSFWISDIKIMCEFFLVRILLQISRMFILDVKNVIMDI